MEKYKNIHQDLIDRCRFKDSDAQFQIYRLYYKSLYNTSFRIVGNQMEAEDIMQDSFLAAFEKLESYKGDVSFGAWLKRIVINRSLDMLKTKVHRTTFEPVDDRLNELPDDEADDTSVGVQASVEQIRNALTQLPDNYRIVFSLYLLEGYDHDEIAQILSITSSTSRSQLTRAKKKVLELIKGV